MTTSYSNVAVASIGTILNQNFSRMLVHTLQMVRLYVFLQLCSCTGNDVYMRMCWIGVTYVSDGADETSIVDRLPLMEAVIDEGDVMYNPPYWLHAVGTPMGLSISVANRVWQDFFVQRDPRYMHNL